MSSKQPSDAAVRAAAIDPTASFLIQAPAGSGKTELLTDRILALLATVNRPEEIVAITFTRKAASEMHARVLAKLQAGQGPRPIEPHKVRGWELAQQAMHRDKAQGWNLLQYPARLAIRTIDSFCAYLVRAMPWVSALGGMPAVTDNAREHYEAAAMATLGMADDYPCVARLIAHLDVDVRMARDLLADMLASRDQWLPLLAQGSMADYLMNSLERAVEADLERLATAMPLGWASSLAEPLRLATEMRARTDPAQGLSPLLDWDGQPFDADMASVSAWQALAAALLTDKNTLRRSVDKRQGFEAKSEYKDTFVAWLKQASGDEPWVEALADIRSAPNDGYTEAQQEVLGVLIEVLWLAAAQLGVRFTEKAEVDFAEISQRALQALGSVDDPSDVLLSLDNAIQHILVDEFQDTSQTQIDLLERLTSGWQQGDGRTLFLVGDPMQSIYRFRKADVGCFLRVRERGLGDIALTALELRENFRSQANLVEWVNRTCGPVFPSESNPTLGAIVYTPSVPFNDPEEGISAEFHPVWVRKAKKSSKGGQDGPEDDDDDGVASAEAVAVQLAQQALQQHPDSTHPVAILVRARAHLDGIVHRLTMQGVPCRAVELVSLQSRQAVIDLAQLARALSHPADRLSWLAVLRSPLCGLTLESLHTLCGADHFTPVPRLLAAWLYREQAGGEAAVQSGIAPDDAARLRLASAILLDDSNASGSMPFAAWLEHTWRRLGGPDIYRNPSDAADTERLFRLIEEIAPYGNLDPDDLERRLEKLYAAPESSGRAVEVMTIHKAKGLEFDTVILAGLHRRPRGDTPPLLRLEHQDGELLLGPIRHRASDENDPVSVYLAAREKKRAMFETDRLLYVALTRARKQLHLIGAVGLDEEMRPKKPAAASLLGRIWDFMPEPTPPQPSELDAEMPGIGFRDPVQRLLVRRPVQVLPALVPAIRTPRRGLPWKWREETGAEAIVGTVAHAWLERIGKEGADAWSPERIASSLPVFRRQLARAGLPEAALDTAAHTLRDTLAATVGSDRGQWLLRVARAHREWSLLDISGRVSVIDLAVSQETDWLVVDYKTGVPGQGESSEHFAGRMRERYRDQIERYCACVSALDGRPARGALYFPRADIWVDYEQDHRTAFSVDHTDPALQPNDEKESRN